ncbi:ribosomal-protein-alanine N-acetyltransferase [Flavobacteriaceae bacterium UJ101]|nr:ribosomal-protein-alanine N-acetyltransferase [Flavobacteriaceae bacterium UJ101]
MKTPYNSFETDRLVLKPTTLEDAEFVLKLLNSPKWIKNIGERNVKSIKDAQNYINKKMTPQLERLGYSNYTVIRKSDGAKLGSCGLYDRDGIDGVDIGFAFFPEYEKKGYAYESASKIKEIAFSQFNIKKISGITIEENISSQKLLEKLGLKFIKIIQLANDPEKLLLYEIEIQP